MELHIKFGRTKSGVLCKCMVFVAGFRNICKLIGSNVIKGNRET
jgi:hypothetical protein